MIKIFLVPLAVMSLSIADVSVKQIQDMVIKIHEQREGVELKTLESTKDPFIQLEQENNLTKSGTDSKEEEKLILHAIINGKAYINDSWSSVDDSIMGYTLKYIGKSGVVLRNGNHIKKLYLHENKDSFIKLEER